MCGGYALIYVLGTVRAGKPGDGQHCEDHILQNVDQICRLDPSCRLQIVSEQDIEALEQQSGGIPAQA